ncbi:hypothetical protein NDU88_012116 [Pleurodeles waltl]|uniref:Uncharacterized protein n=1 Tax=Pleurodeles waltl TaxID=8319 RepID=A0AAV7R516_PLEWA|nr:hypothetical protein NDU88_012116 [Pleurodeles waltl]
MAGSAAHVPARNCFLIAGGIGNFAEPHKSLERLLEAGASSARRTAGRAVELPCSRSQGCAAATPEERRTRHYAAKYACSQLPGLKERVLITVEQNITTPFPAHHILSRHSHCSGTFKSPQTEVISIHFPKDALWHAACAALAPGARLHTERKD